AEPHAPGHLAPVAMLGLAGDLDPLVPGLLPKPGNPARLRRGAGGVIGLVALQRRQLADHDDLLTVHPHLGCTDEPFAWQAPGEPAGRVLRRRQVGLLPAAPAEPAVSMPATSSSHDRYLH